MNITIFFLLIAGTLIMAGHSLSQGYVLNTRNISLKRVLVTQNIIAAVILGVCVLGTAFVFGFATLIPENGLLFLGALFATTCASTYIQWANGEARRIADVSLTAPISALTPGLVTLTAFLLGEFPTMIGWVGIGVIALGTYWFGLGESTRTTRDFLRPFTLLRLPHNFGALSSEEQRKARNNTRALRLAYGGALMGTIGLVADALVVRNGDVFLGFFLYSILLTTIFGVGIVKSGNTNKKKDGTTLLLLVGILWTLHIIVVFVAFAYAPVAYVGSLKRLSIVFVALGSIYILREREAVRRIGPIIIITLGAMCLGLDTTIGKVLDKF